jgi:membrane-associated phospholipid phosphatase
MLAVITLMSAQPLRAQQPKQDSTTIRRARRPLLRWGEVIGVVAVTGLALANDQSIRNRLNDPHDRLGRTVSDIGNGFGDGIIVYSSLLALSVGSKALDKKGVYGVTSRALKSTFLGGAAAIVLKTIGGRDRPSASIDDPYSFHPFRFKDNSFPSGHTAVAFALATSFARETPDKWTDLGFFTLATVTAYARMHDDKHWASDVVFGAGVGILSARFVHRFQAKLAVSPGGIGMSLPF